jgi:hypothetical protein
MNLPQTLSELEKSGFQARTVKAELQQNLIEKIKNEKVLFPGIIGYDDTVIPTWRRHSVWHRESFPGTKAIAGRSFLSPTGHPQHTESADPFYCLQGTIAFGYGSLKRAPMALTCP